MGRLRYLGLRMMDYSANSLHFISKKWLRVLFLPIWLLIVGLTAVLALPFLLTDAVIDITE